LRYNGEFRKKKKKKKKKKGGGAEVPIVAGRCVRKPRKATLLQRVGRGEQIIPKNPSQCNLCQKKGTRGVRQVRQLLMSSKGGCQIQESPHLPNLGATARATQGSKTTPENHKAWTQRPQETGTVTCSRSEKVGDLEGAQTQGKKKSAHTVVL